MKVLKVGIASYDEMKARTLAIARGTLKPGPDDPRIWFSSAESFAKVLSAKNRSLLRIIAGVSPSSLADLAKRSGRAKSNLSRTLKTLERYGLVKLRRGDRGRIAAEVPYKAVSLVMPLEQPNLNKRRRKVAA